ncbi:hypothetical protein UPYG_G00167670 [Umbra pygmaea]|uniref:TRAF family member-associated NF-kappa-B activator n=1 Tax=Umbra pygmaea TaxID=75934 RepID=A0ABD0WSL3_UMBPY
MVMEEAYAQLYREFLQLRSLCLKQAALLQQLTETLRRQQVPPGTGEPRTMPIPIQCSQEGAGDILALPEASVVPTHKPATLPEHPWGTKYTPATLPEHPGVPKHKPTIHHGINGPSRDVGSLSDLLAGGFGRLRLDFAQPGTEQEVLKAAPTRPQELPDGNGKRVAPPASRDSKQASQFWGDDKTREMFRMPSEIGSFMNSEFMNQTGAMMLMSDVALQSQVCDFCHAVFPGHTTTRGDFLRHLHTHIN